MGVTRVHCGAREIKKRAFVWLWFGKKKFIDGKRRLRDPNHYKKETRTRNKPSFGMHLVVRSAWKIQ
jgi:hypothetical protein